jgi:peptide chain release factor 2
MMMKEVEKEIAELEKEMLASDFWQNKDRAQEVLKKINELKEKQKGKNKYDKGDAVITIFSGAGGDDAEDWAMMLFEMYSRFTEKQGWQMNILHEHLSEHKGYKNVSFEVLGKNSYGTLKNESGVHRLVRISPFSAKKLRHTSFALVEVIPKIVDSGEVDIPEKDLKIEFARSSGAGGQNVNKRETAVRLVHLPTGLAVHVETERSQLQNKNRALEILKSKIYRLKLGKEAQERESMKISKIVEAQWGYQIRSYVLHPYKMVKDLRTDYETSDTEGVLNGEIEKFIEAERNI